MKSKSTTQKLKVRWQDRSWMPRIESRADGPMEVADRVTIYQTREQCNKSDTQLIVRHRRVATRSGTVVKHPWKN